MKIRITYKEITMLLGVLVALLVLITLWLRTPGASGQFSGPAAIVPKAPALNLPPPQIFLRKTAELFF